MDQQIEHPPAPYATADGSIGVRINVAAGVFSLALLWLTSLKEWVGLHLHALYAIMPKVSGDKCRSAPRSGCIPAARRT